MVRIIFGCLFGFWCIINSFAIVTLIVRGPTNTETYTQWEFTGRYGTGTGNPIYGDVVHTRLAFTGTEITYLVILVILSAVYLYASYALITSGRRALILKKTVMEKSFALIREAGKIEMPKLMTAVGGNELSIRKILAKAQRQGIIPQNTVIE